MTTGGIRAMDKYLDHIDDIRRVQTYIASRARRENTSRSPGDSRSLAGFRR